MFYSFTDYHHLAGHPQTDQRNQQAHRNHNERSGENPDVNVAEWLDKLAPENKSKLLKEKLLTKLTWGIICLILGIGTIVYGACSSFASSMPTFLGGGALLAVGIALLVSFFFGKKFLAKEIEAESKKNQQ